MIIWLINNSCLKPSRLGQRYWYCFAVFKCSYNRVWVINASTHRRHTSSTLRLMTHQTFVAQVAHVTSFVAESCNKSRNKKLNSDQLYFSATCYRNTECWLTNSCLRLDVFVSYCLLAKLPGQQRSAWWPGNLLISLVGRANSLTCLCCVLIETVVTCYNFFIDVICLIYYPHMLIGMLGIYHLLFVCFFIRRILVTDISGVGWHRAMKFCRMVDLGVHLVFSPFGELWPRG